MSPLGLARSSGALYFTVEHSMRVTGQSAIDVGDASRTAQRRDEGNVEAAFLPDESDERRSAKVYFNMSWQQGEGCRERGEGETPRMARWR